MPAKNDNAAARLNPGRLQPPGMLDKQADRLGPLAHQPQGLVDDIEVVQGVVIADHRAQV